MSASAPQPLRLENKHTGEVLELARRKENGEIVLELRGTLGPHGEGPPLHTHHFEDEMGTVTRGTLSALVGGQRVNTGPGQAAMLPKGVPHRWWNEGDEPLAFSGYARPVVDLDRYLQAAFEVINASPKGRPSLIYFAHLVLRHRHTQSVFIMPAPIQAVFFRVAFVVGTLLGKYRGTDWPGCPARCTGAPMVDDTAP
ncbi:MAG: cupin domain-containing protein [Vicinamibacterales bacterium]